MENIIIIVRVDVKILHRIQIVFNGGMTHGVVNFVKIIKWLKIVDVNQCKIIVYFKIIHNV